METYLENLQYFIGGLITIYGIDKAVMFFEVKKEEKAKVLCEAIVQVILGVCTIILFKEISTICVIWAVWSIMRESEEIAECYENFKEKLPWILSFAESVVAIVFSITLIMEPGEHHAKIHMILLIVELMSAVIFPQLVRLYAKYIKKEDSKKSE